MSGEFGGLEHRVGFQERHLGTDANDLAVMLATVGYTSTADLLDDLVPEAIRDRTPINLPEAVTEAEVQRELHALASLNTPRRPFIGLGYHGTFTPAVLRRNILENPGWYTAYTPYQPEISQGRLEALLVFQTMVTDLTGTELAGASLLDEATAAAEAMQMCRRVSKKVVDVPERVLVDRHCHPQTIAVLTQRAEPLEVTVDVVDLRTADLQLTNATVAVLQSPDTRGVLHDDAALIETLHQADIQVVVATDLLACTLITPPGEQGADAVVGSTQRFGVPLFAGGPHAAFLATREANARHLPGRLVGVSEDVDGRPAFRLALQTREQHIRREKATSNICTSQVLLAVMAGMFAVHHGPQGLTRIARRTHVLSSVLRAQLIAAGLSVVGDTWFDTITLRAGEKARAMFAAAREAGFELGRVPDASGALYPGDGEHVRIALDETATLDDITALVAVLAGIDTNGLRAEADRLTGELPGIPRVIARTSTFLNDRRFSLYRSETELMRWLQRLRSKDIALDQAMIPLGSCTMKLNAAVEMEAVSDPAFAAVHPFAPRKDLAGTARIVADLEQWLAEITGYDAVSLQPNSGAQGELAGLLAIRGYHQARGDEQRNVCLIPSSAHGTNAASAVMAGMRVVVVGCDDAGNIAVDQLRSLAAQYDETLAAVMVTYPSTHGVFEATITEVCDIVHGHGGQVYLDGANMNALVGVARPGWFGADISHLNLHKTFCIPHGGGGPGVGPVACRTHLAPYLPSHPLFPDDRASTTTHMVGPIAAAPWGSAGILQISWAYVRLMGGQGLRLASENAIVAANYIATRLGDAFPVLYSGAHGLVAHEAIIDVRPMKASSSVSNADVAKRLIDYGFHAPTMSFPVAGTLMIEPTESEARVELDRFCDAMLAIRQEIDAVERGVWPHDNNPLTNAPHPAQRLLSETWSYPYPRQVAAYPLASVTQRKYWVPVGRIDDAYGDRNLVCSCPPIESFVEAIPASTTVT
ncbi:MAG: aminomethyl-transferring glycine dehydrogenase [Nitriliruptoraceae bacterium]